MDSSAEQAVLHGVNADMLAVAVAGRLYDDEVVALVEQCRHRDGGEGCTFGYCCLMESRMFRRECFGISHG